MKLKHLPAIVAASLALTACEDPVAVLGDLNGEWEASSYVWTHPTSGATVDVIARDNVEFTLTIDTSVDPPTTFAVYDEGLVDVDTATGTVDVFGGTLSIGGGDFVVTHAGDMMTLVNIDGIFDFGSGFEAASVTIVLERL